MLMLLAGFFGTVVQPLNARQEDENRLTFSGNVGFRVEYIANELFYESSSQVNDDNRMRFRVRLRFGAQYKASDVFTTGFRLTTGPPDFPSSEWSSLNDLFNRDVIRIDRAYVRADPAKWLHLRFGIDENPLFRPDEMVWDSDVAPAGLAEVLRFGDLQLIFGQWMLREVRDIRPDNQEASFLLGNGFTFTGGTNTRFTIGGFQYYYNRPNAIATAIQLKLLNAEFRTNRFDPVDTLAYFSDYNTLGAAFRVVRARFTLLGDFAVNVGAKQDASLGVAYANKENVAAGGTISYDKRDRPWGWSVTAGFYHIEADAVIAVYDSDDLQQTNVNSVPIWIRLNVPGGAQLIWDTYFQKKANVNLASIGGIVHDENALKVRTRLTLQVNY